MKIQKILDTAILTTCGFVMAGAASATPVQIPEPGTLSVLGLGVGALYLISRHNRRK